MPATAAAARTTPWPLRGYQKRIVETAATENTLIVLPTDAGKTAGAGATIAARGGVALFLVPTRVLVEQQATAVALWTGLRVRSFSGGMAVPAPGSFRVLITTPAAFLAAQVAGASALQ